MEIKPGNYGTLGKQSTFERQGFIIRKIQSLEVVATGKVSDDLMILPGVCCLATERGKSFLCQNGAESGFFHKTKITGILVESNIYYIDIGVKTNKFEIYRGTTIIVDDSLKESIKKELKVSKCKFS